MVCMYNLYVFTTTGLCTCSTGVLLSLYNWQYDVVIPTKHIEKEKGNQVPMILLALLDQMN